MITLNERVYRCLQQAGKPMTAQAVAALEEFRYVPPMAVCRAMLDIQRQRAVTFRVEDGKMYFSTDMEWGCRETGAQENLNRLSSINNLFGGGRSAASMLGMGSVAFPETAEDYPDYFNHVDFDPKRYSAGEFSLCFPAGATVHKNPDEKHHFHAECSVDAQGEGSFSIWTSINAIDGDAPSRDASLAQAKMLAGHFSNMVSACTDAPECYRSDNVDAAFSLSSPNTFIIIAMPKGLLTVRIDWNVDTLPPAGLVRNMVLDLLKTYRYTGRDAYYLPKNLTQVPEKELVEETEKGLNSYNRIVNAAKTGCSNNKSKMPAVKKLLLCRTQLEEAAQAIDGYVVEFMDMLRSQVRTCRDSDLLNTLFNAAMQLFDICANIDAEVELPASAIGPYNSATDVVFGAGKQAETVAVSAIPAHCTELLKLVTLDRIEVQKPSAEEQDKARRFYREQLNALNQLQKEADYHPDFKLEGTTLAAYLGSGKDVVIPQGVRSIGDFAFKGCHQLETVTLCESVEHMGFAVFDDCPNLKTLTLSPDLAHAAGPFFGFGPNLSYGKRKPQGPLVRVYAGTFGEKHAKENNYRYEVIPEEAGSPIVNLDGHDLDRMNKLLLPLPKGFLSGNRDPKTMKREDMSHLFYAAVPGDTPGGLTGYKDAVFSVSGTMAPMDVPNALKISEDIEQRLNGVDHVHNKFRTCTAENGKIIVKYDMTREGTMEDTPWGQYLVLIFHDDVMDSVQIYINGKFTHRQQEKAVRTWAEKIRLERIAGPELKRKAQAEAARKQQSAVPAAPSESQAQTPAEPTPEERYQQAMKKYNQDHAAWEQEKKATERRRSSELQKRLREARTQREQEIASNFERSIAHVQDCLDYARAQKAAATEELSKLGFFAFGQKKLKQSLIQTMSLREADAQQQLDQLEAQRKEQMQQLSKEMDALNKKLSKEMEELYPLPLEPQKPEDPRKPVSAPSYTPMSAFSIANQGIKDAILETLRDMGTLATITDIMMNCPAAADLTNQRVSALVRQLVSEGLVERVEDKRKCYFQAI